MISRTPEYWLPFMSAHASTMAVFVTVHDTDGELTKVFLDVLSSCFSTRPVVLTPWQERGVRAVTDHFRDIGTTVSNFHSIESSDMAAKVLWRQTRAAREQAKDLLSLLNEQYIGTLHGPTAAARFRCTLSLRIADFSPLDAEKKATVLSISEASLPTFAPPPYPLNYNDRGFQPVHSARSISYRGRGRGRVFGKSTNFTLRNMRHTYLYVERENLPHTFSTPPLVKEVRPSTTRHRVDGGIRK